MYFLDRVLEDSHIRELKRVTGLDISDASLEVEAVRIGPSMRQFISGVMNICNRQRNRFPAAYEDAFVNLQSSRTHMLAAFNYLAQGYLMKSKKRTERPLFAAMEVYPIYQEARRILHENPEITNFEPSETLLPLEEALIQVESTRLYKSLLRVDPQRSAADSAYRAGVRKVIGATSWLEEKTDSLKARLGFDGQERK
ncbi:TPA: hypothetical protein HA265_07670 [Candidatus Woesearchaeota archaeon]|nr:hypothetical protein [Candidatus Woesearchaeota archaeon]